MSLPLLADGRLVATVETTGEGPHLRYDAAWLAAPDAFRISLTMPLTVAEHGPDVAVPWLMNLLPEGEPLRAMTRALGVAREDILGLIAELGRDLAGALTIGAPRAGESPGFVPLARHEDLERIIEELPAKPFLVGEDGVSMSLAGAQEKLPLARQDGGLGIPINGAPSTVILKPDNPRLAGSVQNEALCMVLARRCGLPVAPVTTGVAGKRAYLLVDRYDRAVDGGQVLRLHQEDFCQALGRPPAAKYEHNRSGVKGPSLAEMFGLVRVHMTARETTRLLDAVIFNIAIGNVDSHAKNYSVLLGPGRPTLAPLYDLMSGLAWTNITQNHAQDIGGQQRGRHIYARHWRRMAEAAGLAGPATVRRVIQVAERVAAELPAASAEVAAMPAGGAMLERIVGEIGARAALVAAHAREEGDDAVEQTPEPATGDSAYPA
ncbi:type II toxin-antitoxin system HipA family toxin [Phenylobacterium sp.]|uniref:type II toxin-antitoxin system HipA family toxin n=1 Tax=Phenylobacterium sp. TaxID=1871053 RepID=UPI0025E29855|nr:type II toxin-antitoxin system HipA family toxin [Phenylobacterium sp.]